jgi:hypothetical protein
MARFYVTDRQRGAFVRAGLWCRPGMRCYAAEIPMFRLRGGILGCVLVAVSACGGSVVSSGSGDAGTTGGIGGSVGGIGGSTGGIGGSMGGFGGSTGGVGGTCGSLATCNGACVDLGHDPLHCGSCNNACGDEQACVNGHCGCPAGTTDCGGTCADLATDPQNCGICGDVCPPGQACVAGLCTSPPSCCSDSQNLNASPITNCFHGLTWLAGRYQPSCNIAVTAITLHTDGGQVALLADQGGVPGAVLGKALVPSVSPPDWTTGSFTNPIPLAAGKVYWIAEGVSVCSQTGSGDAQPYYGASSLSGPWDGPYQGAFWTSQIAGACPK